MADAEDVPKMKADQELRAFRHEAELCWQDFNRLWMQICNHVNSPAHDVLLSITATGPEYEHSMEVIITDVLAGGTFGVDRPGIWKYGRHESEPDHVA